MNNTTLAAAKKKKTGNVARPTLTTPEICTALQSVYCRGRLIPMYRKVATCHDMVGLA